MNNFVGREKERPSLTPDDFEIEEEDPVRQTSYSSLIRAESREISCLFSLLTWTFAEQGCQEKKNRSRKCTV